MDLTGQKLQQAVTPVVEIHQFNGIMHYLHKKLSES